MSPTGIDNLIGQQPPELERVDSVDVLRGGAVLLLFASINGARAVYALPPSAVIDVLRVQLRPSLWHGVTAADLCWPAFPFIAGMSLAISFQRRQDRGGSHADWARHVLVRGAGLFTVGLLIENVRAAARFGFAWTGPLPQLAVCIAAGGLLMILLRRPSVRIAVAMLLLAGYGSLLAWHPLSAGQGSSGDFANSLPAVIDAQALPGRKFFGSWDPHGILTTLPAFAILLAGAGVGAFLLKHRLQHGHLVAGIVVFGLACANVGILLNTIQPWNPHLNTPAFALASMAIGGFATAVTQMFERSARRTLSISVLAAIGRNSLLLVLLLGSGVLMGVSDRFVADAAADWLGVLTPICRLACELAMVIILTGVLYWRRLFLTI